MSRRRKTVLAGDMKPGDTIELVYQIRIDKIGNLDKLIPTESKEMQLVTGKCTRGPLRGYEGKFAVLGTEKMKLIGRPNMWTRLKDRLFPNKKVSKKKSVPRDMTPMIFKRGAWSY